MASSYNSIMSSYVIHYTPSSYNIVTSINDTYKGHEARVIII